jgi:hypothetical protein
MVDTSHGDDHYRYEELFKLYLDPDFNDHYDGAPSLTEARGWFADFLSCIYRAVDRHLQETIPKYTTKNVEFRFSVPTTWKNPAMIAEMEQLIQNSGFGTKNARHTAHIALTEAEAAAVYASKQQYAVGDVFLICDAGGGTSDVSILKVVSSEIGQTELEPLSWVEGRAVGSTLIDFRVEKLIAERLSSIQHFLASDPATIAHRMLRESSRFESFKCNFGDAAMDLPTLRIPVPGLEYGKDYGSAHIEGSHMIIQKEELRGIFDDQIEKIMALIEEQLATLQNMNPSEEITYLVLSGGLGSSPYLQKVLQARYELGASRFANAKDIQILKVPKPQLAVSHGIVLDRVQQIKENRIVYKQRYCRCSYGVVVRQEYNPKLHSGEILSADPRDKKVWAERQIDWFIVQVSLIVIKNVAVLTIHGVRKCQFKTGLTNITR